MPLFRRAALKCGTTGLAAGTIYFIVIGVLTLFNGVLISSVPTMLWLVLFIGAGAGLGLALGLIAAAVMAIVLPPVDRGAGDQSRRLRWAGAAAAGLPVLVFTTVEQLTGAIGVLSPDVTTVIVIPTVIAACGGAAAAPALVGR
ncbi:MAG TPA: hypothetical protein VMT88_00645 [Actinomycetes bacterium]|nr:hypothetical protein [Actinomycetes bacterium]